MSMPMATVLHVIHAAAVEPRNLNRRNTIQRSANQFCSRAEPRGATGSCRCCAPWHSRCPDGGLGLLDDDE
jgi:hypothetical protein